MSCLRCGKETTNEQLFCADCLAQMDRQPVKPGTPVYIPHRSHEEPLKQIRKRRAATPEERLKVSKTLNQWLVAAVAVLTILSSVLGIFLHDALNNRESEPPVGRNYAYVGDTTNR